MTSWVQDGCKLGAVELKLLDLVNLLWEVAKNEFVDRLLTVIDDLVEHLNNHASWNVLVSMKMLNHLKTNNSLSLHLALSKLLDIEVKEALLLKVSDDGVAESLLIVSRSDVDNDWLDMSVDLAHGLLDGLIVRDLLEVCLFFKERKKILGFVVILFDHLAQNGRRNVSGVTFAKVDHSLLADVFTALKGEDVGWYHSIVQEELSLKHVLWEVLDGDSWANHLSEVLNELCRHLLIIISRISHRLDELLKVNQLHISSLCECISNLSLTRGFWSKKEHALRKNSLFSLSIHLSNTAGGIDMSDLSELFVVVYYWHALVEIGLNSHFNGFGVVVFSSGGLSSLHASLNHELLWNIIEEDLICLHHILLEILGLVDGSWEPINQISL